MQTDRGELHSPVDWFLIACNGDLVLKLAHDLNVGEDAAGDLILNPSDEEALLKVASVDDQLTLQVLALDMTLSVAGDRSVQYLAIDSGGPVRVRLPHNSLSLSRDFLDGGRERRPANVRQDFLDIALMRAIQPAITTERMSLSQTVAAATADDSLDDMVDMIGPLAEVDVIDDDDYRRAAQPPPRTSAEAGAEPSIETSAEPAPALTPEVAEAEEIPEIEEASETGEIPEAKETPEVEPVAEEPAKGRHRAKIIAMIILFLAAALISLSVGE